MRNWNFLMRIRSSVAWTETLWLFLFYIIRRIRSYSVYVRAGEASETMFQRNRHDFQNGEKKLYLRETKFCQIDLKNLRIWSLI